MIELHHGDANGETTLYYFDAQSKEVPHWRTRLSRLKHWRMCRIRWEIGMLEVVFLAALLMVGAQSAVAQTPDPVLDITGTVTLQWVAPVENVDGSTLDDLAGYKIYWGLQSRQYLSPPLDVTDGQATNWSFSFDAVDEQNIEWYFAMTAYDVDGNESAFSNEVLKTVTITVTDNRPPAPPTLQTVDGVFTCTTNNAQVTCTVTIQ